MEKIINILLIPLNIILRIFNYLIIADTMYYIDNNLKGKKDFFCINFYKIHNSKEKFKKINKIKTIFHYTYKKSLLN